MPANYFIGLLLLQVTACATTGSPDTAASAEPPPASRVPVQPVMAEPPSDSKTEPVTPVITNPPPEPVAAPVKPAADAKPVASEKPAAKPEAKLATPAPQPPKQPQKVVAAPAPAAPVPMALATLEQRLKDTDAIGVFTKLTLKNQVDDLLNRAKSHHQGSGNITLAQLRQSYDQLLTKVHGLLKDGDPALANAIIGSRESIWTVLMDPVKFAKL